MSSISSLGSPTSPYQTPGAPGPSQIIKDFKAIGEALQTGDASAAQGALATFQQDIQGNSPASASQSSSNQPFGKNTKANADFQSLVTAIQSGDTSSAQKAFASLQTDLKSAQGAKGHHHHHHSSGSQDSTVTAPATAATASGTPATGLNATA